jgi:hypothetical protein
LLNYSYRDESVTRWNYNSSLKNVVAIVLGKLEGKQQNVNYNQGQGIINPNQGRQGQGNQFQNQPQPNIQQNQIPSQEEDIITQELVKDLNNKSIEELIFINFNQDDYVYEFTNKQRQNNAQLLQEVSGLSENTEKLKAQYEEIKAKIDDTKKQYEEKEKELREVYNQKQLLDSKFTVEKLIEEIKKNIDENYQKPRQKLINEFLSKKIDFETFKENFKELSMKYHYYNLIKDKLNLYKI